MLILSRKYSLQRESAFFVETAGIIPTNTPDSNGHTRQTCRRGVSAMIAPLLRCLCKRLIEKIERRYTDPVWLVPQCGKIILH